MATRKSATPNTAGIISRAAEVKTLAKALATVDSGGAEYIASTAARLDITGQPAEAEKLHAELIAEAAVEEIPFKWAEPSRKTRFVQWATMGEFLAPTYNVLRVWAAEDKKRRNAQRILQFLGSAAVKACKGLDPDSAIDALEVLVDGSTIADLCAKQIADASAGANPWDGIVDGIKGICKAALSPLPAAEYEELHGCFTSMSAFAMKLGCQAKSLATKSTTFPAHTVYTAPKAAPKAKRGAK